MIFTAKGRNTGRIYNFNRSMEIGAGGEGRIYDVDGKDNEVAKVYKKAKLNHERSKKLEIMVANPPENILENGHPTIAFPSDVLEYTGKSGPDIKNGQIVGYIMPKLKHNMKKIFNFSDSRSRLLHNPFFTYDYLMNAAINFVTAVNKIHESSYVIGDINESNIMVNETNTFVTLIDTDSFQVKDPKSGYVYRCPVGKMEYTPPELQDIKFDKVTRSFHHDLFGMAIILYQLLMENTHPFSGIYQESGDPPEYGASIKQGFFVYKKKSKSPYKPQPTALPFETLNPDIQNLFLRCFEDGHADPSARPSAKEWRSVLKKGKKSLSRCSRNPNHYFGDHLSLCPWCERLNKIPFDSFPADPVEAQKIQQFFQTRAAQKRSNVQARNVIPKPVINSFQANATSIKEGQSLTLSWDVTNAQSVSISPGFAGLSGNGSLTVSPNQNTDFILTAIAYGQHVTKRIHIEVEPKPEVIFDANVDSILLGQPITLSWNVSPNYSVEINNGIGKVGNSGKMTVTPVRYFWGLFEIRDKNNIVYTLTAANQRERIRQSFEITISLPDSPTELANHISLSSKSVPLNRQNISLSDFITLNQPISLSKDRIELLEYTPLSNHLGLKKISVSLSDFIELLDPKTSEKGESILGFYKKLFKNFRVNFLSANPNFFWKRNEKQKKSILLIK